MVIQPQIQPWSDFCRFWFVMIHIALTHCYKLESFFNIIFAVFLQTAVSAIAGIAINSVDVVESFVYLGSEMHSTGSLSRSWPQFVYGPVSRKRLEIQTWFEWTTNRKWTEIQMVTWRYLTWRMTSHDPERSRSWHVSLKVINSWSTAV